MVAFFCKGVGSSQIAPRQVIKTGLVESCVIAEKTTVTHPTKDFGIIITKTRNWR